MNRIISAGDIVSLNNKEYQVELIAGITAKLINANEPIYVKVSTLTFIRITKLLPLEKLHAIIDTHLRSPENVHIPQIDNLYTTKSYSLTDIYKLTKISESSLCTLEDINKPENTFVFHKDKKPYDFIFVAKETLYKGE